MSDVRKASKPTPWCCLDVAELIDAARQLPRTHEETLWSLQFKRQAEDFQVDEVLGFELSGSGEHLWLQVCKTGINTAEVVRRLSAAAGIAPRLIGFAGLKDRHGICRQWLSLHLPGWRTEGLPPELRSGHQWPDGALRIEQTSWNHRKLKRGSHRANRFCVRVYAAQPFSAAERVAIQQRLARIGEQGVPNYFGEQRFGFDNLGKAVRLFSGEAVSGKPLRLTRNERSLVLSAARSALFNAVLAERVREGNWNRYLDGDVLNLAGSGSVFVAEAGDPEIAERVSQGDVHPTGPLWGRGENRTLRQARALEDDVLSAWQLFRHGLEQAGLEQQRRSLRLPVQALNYRFFQDAALLPGLELTFTLPTGSYATAVLHELMRQESATLQQDTKTMTGAESVSGIDETQ